MVQCKANRICVLLFKRLRNILQCILCIKNIHYRLNGQVLWSKQQQLLLKGALFELKGLNIQKTTIVDFFISSQFTFRTPNCMQINVSENWSRKSI